MNEYVLIEKQELAQIADKVRSLSGSTETMNVLEIDNKFDTEVSSVKEALSTWLINNGETVKDGASLKEMVNTVETVKSLDTSDATAVAGDILSGETAYVNGQKITGTIPTKTASNLTASGATVTVPSGYYASQATKSVTTATQATPSITVNSSGLITATATQTAGYVAAGSKSATKQLAFQAAKTITPSTSEQTAVASGVYTTGAVKVAAIPSTYIKPSYTKAATTYTPKTTNQTISAGTYLTGAQTIKGDANLVAGNIKSGVSIFGVAGNYAGSGGGDTSLEGIISRTIKSYTNDKVTTIGSYAFCFCQSLTTANFPAVTTISRSAFYNCVNLTTVSFPAATSIMDNAFEGCLSLTTVSFPAATYIREGVFRNCYRLTTASFPAATAILKDAFNGCTKLKTVSFPVATIIHPCAFEFCYSLYTASFPAVSKIMSSAFYSCTRLKSLYLTGSTVCKLSASNAFSSTPIGGYSTSAGTYGSIYVPASLLASYKTATNWTYFSSRFVGI